MEAKDYSIVATSEVDNGNEVIYNIKLTDELVKKLMKGQKDLDNLHGVEFSISDKCGIDVTVYNHILPLTIYRNSRLAPNCSIS